MLCGHGFLFSLGTATKKPRRCWNNTGASQLRPGKARPCYWLINRLVTAVAEASILCTYRRRRPLVTPNRAEGRVKDLNVRSISAPCTLLTGPVRLKVASVLISDTKPSAESCTEIRIFLPL